VSNVDITQEEIEKADDEKLHEMIVLEIQAISTGFTERKTSHARNLVALMAEADLRRRNDKFLKRCLEPAEGDSEAGSSGPYPLD